MKIFGGGYLVFRVSGLDIWLHWFSSLSPFFSLVSSCLRRLQRRKKTKIGDTFWISSLFLVFHTETLLWGMSSWTICRFSQIRFRNVPVIFGGWYVPSQCFYIIGFGSLAADIVYQATKPNQPCIRCQRPHERASVLCYRGDRNGVEFLFFAGTVPFPSMLRPYFLSGASENSGNYFILFILSLFFLSLQVN